MRHTVGAAVTMIALIVLIAVSVGLADRTAAAPPNKGGSTLSTPTQNWDAVLPADQRFTVLAAFNNDAVRDNETGLVWERSPQLTPDDWSSARYTCANKAVGGRKGWRLPSLPELTSLVDIAVVAPGPVLPSGHPFLNVQPAFYFSATSNAFLDTDVWGVDFANGNVTKPLKSSTGQTLCVRGSMNTDTY